MVATFFGKSGSLGKLGNSKKVREKSGRKCIKFRERRGFVSSVKICTFFSSSY